MRFSLLLLILIGSLSTLRGQVPGPGSYQAAIWDKEIVLPPGSYRAGKPIEVNGDFTVRTQPHSLIEGAAFLTRGGRQHYHIEGTVLRRCRITVKMNSGGHLIDSVLEDCDFSKDDAWYMFWWSTHWRFDNCILTKKLVRGDVYPLDYSVHASRCTVYGAKLPPVGFKENSATWMGKDDMVFERCRFVDCEVPQSFLACTKDCVFEGCRFEPKTQLKWPKETGPIKVHAYFASGGSEPASFINGPLSVEFEKEPMSGGEFGSTLPHTQSGGRVTLTKEKLSDQFAILGGVPKKASEIVDVAAGAAPTPGTAGATAANEISSLEEILRTLPANVEVMARGLPNPAGVEAANAFLAKTFVGRAVAMRLTSASTQAVTDAGYAYQVNGKPSGLLYHGVTFSSGVTALFRAANAAPPAKTAANAEIAVRGIVNRAEFVGRGTTLGFGLVMAEAQVVDALSPRASTAGVGTLPAPGGGPGSGAAANEETQVIGVWNALCHVDASHFDVHFDADHSFYADGKRVGTWEIKNHQLVATGDGERAETYDLPVREGVLYGKDRPGWPLTLVRPGTPTPPAVQAQAAGLWAFKNLKSPTEHTYRFNADRTVKEGEKLIGRWVTFGNAVVIVWEGHPEWHDMFELPGAGGTLIGINGAREALTLTRKGAAPPSPTPAGTPQAGYFGTKTPN